MRASNLVAAVVVAAAAALYFAPPPAGVPEQTVHAAALVLFTVGLWASGALPEHVTGLLFFTLAMVLAVAPAQVVFSGFASATLWLVLGGLVIAEAVNRTGLARRLAAALFERYAQSYPRLVAAVVAAAIALAFVMPATVGRVLLILPIVFALAERVGFERGGTGYNGLTLAALMATYQCGTTILPANAPNLVLAGSAEALYGMQITYAEYLWAQFPVFGLVKGAAIVALICWLFPAKPKPAPAPREAAPLTPAERRMAAILITALVLWATDFLHGVQSGWIALAAAIACLLPRVGVMPVAAFHEVRLGPYFYVGATLGLGLVTQTSGLSEALGRVLERVLALEPGAHFWNFAALSVLTTVAGLFTTNPAQPAVLAPLAEHFAQAAGWPLKTALMTIGVGFTTFLLPYQVPPMVVGMQVAALRLAPVMRLALPLVASGFIVMLPLQYLWWRLIGYFGQ
ncbi:MAG TPA: SLC13 family permease [Burkholderiales bacterium]|nr:SLC13 family permease [Burkholderiales bacterium]